MGWESAGPGQSGIFQSATGIEVCPGTERSETTERSQVKWSEAPLSFTGETSSTTARPPPRGVKRDVLQLFASDRVWGKFGSSDRLWVGIVAHCKARGYLLFAGIVPRGNPE